MNIDKSLMSGSNGMLILKLLEDSDKYGYQMIEELAKRSDHTFDMKAGTLYPLLHTLEEKGWISAYDAQAGGRVRRYYRLTREGKDELRKKEEAWNKYADGVRRILEGGACLA